MKTTDMSNYVRKELWLERVVETIDDWEKIKGITVSDEIKDGVYKFMATKISKGIKKNTLTRIFMQIAVTSLLYIKLKGIK
jgi:hypothetical protein